MPIKITISMPGPDGGKTELTHKVRLADLGVSRKEARDTFYMDEAVHEHILYQMINVDYEKVER